MKKYLKSGKITDKVLVLETKSGLYSIIDTKVVKISNQSEIEWLQENRPNLEES